MDTHGYVSTEEAREALRQIYRNDSESNLQTTLLESLSATHRRELKSLAPLLQSLLARLQ